MRRLAWALAAAAACTAADAQLRILDYNVAATGSASSGPRAGMDTVLRAIGDQTLPGFARPIDIMLIQEGASVSTTGQAYAATLNTIAGGTAYRHSIVDGLTTGGGRPMAIYNSSVVELISEQGIGSVGTTAQPRQTMRYQFRPVGYDATADFYVYNSHLKSSNDSTSINRRDIEMSVVRADADALGEGANVIYVGDWNLYTASEPAFQTVRSAGNGQAFDPVGQIGSWSGNAAFKAYHTQSPATTAAYGGQVTGGLNDRFDFQMVSGEWLDGRGLELIPGSYWAFGNTNTHTMSGAITTGSAASLQALLPGYTVEQSGTLLTTMSRVTDHLPVVADYRLPARMMAGIGAVPARVIRGASVTTSLTVTNSAPVGVAEGADRLDYAFTSSGGCVGSGTGSDVALGGGATHAIALVTSAAGFVSGTVAVAATSHQTASPNLTQTVTLGVLDHAIGSLSASGPVTSLDVDFGTLMQGSGAATRTFTVANLAGSLGASWTAALDLDAIAADDPATRFQTTVSPFTGLAAGASRTYGLSMLTTATGSFSGRYTLSLSDEDLPGAAAQTLTLTLRGAVVSPDSVVLDVAGGAKTQLDLGYAAIGGAASVTKTGTGTAILDAANSYTGPTQIAQGVLAITGSGGIAGSPTIDVATNAAFDVTGIPGGFVVSAGQTLGGTGTVLGSVVFGRGSTMSPGLFSAAASHAFSGDTHATLGGDDAIAVPEPQSLLAAAVVAGAVAARAARRCGRG
jgi:autotransporter-associated beta strand protein